MKLRVTLYLTLLAIVSTFLYLIISWTTLTTTRTIEFPGEGIYAGQIKSGFFHGQGTWTTDFDVTYVGEFEKGVFHGTGTMTFANGATYRGEFKNGFMHGHGIMIFPDGHIHEGYWDADDFLGDHVDCDEDH